MLEDRTQDILAAAVREFIRTGDPVSSGWLYDRYDFGIKPAMIRWMLRDLDDAGYLLQPNYSAGRIPSDRGYEFYANYLLENDEPSGGSLPAMTSAFAAHDWPELLSNLSRELGTLGAACALAGGETWKTGLEALIDHLEWETHGELKAVIRDAEFLDKRLSESKTELARSGDVQVYVGKKSPVTRCQNLSVVAAQYETDGDRMLVLAIGPKRMDYRKAISTFRKLKRAESAPRKTKMAKL